MDSKELTGYGFALAASVLFFVVGYFVRKNQNWLTKYGTRVTGTVIDNIEHTYDGGKSYTPVFFYKTEDGIEITRTRGYSSCGTGLYKIGQPIKIIYDPADPYDYILEDGNADGMGVLCYAIGITIIFISCMVALVIHYKH